MSAPHAHRHGAQSGPDCLILPNSTPDQADQQNMKDEYVYYDEWKRDGTIPERILKIHRDELARKCRDPSYQCHTEIFPHPKKVEEELRRSNQNDVNRDTNCGLDALRDVVGPHRYDYLIDTGKTQRTIPLPAPARYNMPVTPQEEPRSKYSNELRPPQHRNAYKSNPAGRFSRKYEKKLEELGLAPKQAPTDEEQRAAISTAAQPMDQRPDRPFTKDGTPQTSPARPLLPKSPTVQSEQTSPARPLLQSSPTTQSQPIPAGIWQLINLLKSLPKSYTTGLPARYLLLIDDRFKDDIDQRTGCLKKTSVLWPYVGNTTLLPVAFWKFLVGPQP